MENADVCFVDMESALPVQPKPRSPAVSAASKEDAKASTPVEESPDAESLNGVKATNIYVSSSDKKATAIPDITEGTMDSKKAKEDKQVGAAPVAKDSQEKLPAGEQGEKPLSYSCFCFCLLLALACVSAYLKNKC